MLPSSPSGGKSVQETVTSQANKASAMAKSKAKSQVKSGVKQAVGGGGGGSSLKEQLLALATEAIGGGGGGGGGGGQGGTKSTGDPYAGPFPTPYEKFNFIVELEGKQIAGFQSVSGLEMNIEYDTHDPGGHHGDPVRLPGKVTHSDLTLERGLTNNAALFNWTQSVMTNSQKAIEDPEKVQLPITIKLQNRVKVKKGGNYKVRGKWAWQLQKAMPVSWKGPDMDASSSGVALEEVTISYAGIKMSEQSKGPNSSSGGGGG